MQDTVITPSDFVALLNQTLEIAYPLVAIEGELSSFRVSKGRWVYFDLKDEYASVSFFGSVYQLPGPLEDGLTVRVLGNPRLHPRFGFSVNFQSIQAVGEGAIKKAADLLAKKLEAEGLFAPERKRMLPDMPATIGLITAAGSAAYADFIKIMNERWGGVEIQIIDVLVQGDNSAGQLVKALEVFNTASKPPEVIVMTRGGGSMEDLASFSDERVVRAVASSRIPTLVAVGHEVDVSLAELAADVRASTPTNAAQVVVPDRKQELANLDYEKRHLSGRLEQLHQVQTRLIESSRDVIASYIERIIQDERTNLQNYQKLSKLLDPRAALRRGYAVVSKDNKYLKTVREVAQGDILDIEIADGRINSVVKSIKYGR
jgi:exodeoxyribonuclease VII large subunit